MSNYHVLETNKKDCQSQIAFHIAVPNEDNAVGVNLQTAMKEYMEARRAAEDKLVVSEVPWLETDFAIEYTAIENGEIYEHIMYVEYSANMTTLQKRNVMDAKYTALSSIVPNEIRSKLRFWGFNRDVT